MVTNATTVAAQTQKNYYNKIYVYYYTSLFPNYSRTRTLSAMKISELILTLFPQA